LVLELPIPPLTDGNIALRPVELRDAALVGRVFRDPQWLRWFGEGKDARAHVERVGVPWEQDEAYFTICDHGRDEYLGEVALRLQNRSIANLEYWLLPESRGGGRTTRAVRLVSTWAFEELGIARLQLWTEPENPASQRVAERSGFEREGLLRSNDEIAGRRVDSVLYARLPSDPPGINAPRGTPFAP
jgi:[ribosomal protein S5]-alanine N-acetyltransferase